MNLKFIIRQYIKTAVQGVFLPVIYSWYKRKPVRKGVILFADAHHTSLPYSMEYLYERVKEEGFQTEEHFEDFGKASFPKVLKAMLRFMKSYATAESVILCDYYLPAGACKKRQDTEVIQLWHGCGAYKRFGYDAAEDMSSHYKGNSMKNCSLVTVSSPWCEPVYAGALGISQKAVKALGISRTDRYFLKEYTQACRDNFYAQYPQAKGKKIVLWAPTFRGNARMPRLEGLEEIRKLQEEKKKEWFIIIKLHPHLEGKAGRSNCSILTEELLPVADVLITDYSSILFDYMIFKKPMILYAPDSGEYIKNRGFYLDYNKIPAVKITDSRMLKSAIEESAQASKEEWDYFYEQQMKACDGHATDRILKVLRKSENTL